MADYTTAQIRNLAVVGHGAVGKTTLVEQMLFKTGKTTRMGSVDDRSSVLDYESQERSRQMSIDSAIAHLDAHDVHMNLVDAPGALDFVCDAISALAAVETALITIAAPSGIELNTRKMWKIAGGMGRARAIVITKMDGENILDHTATLAKIQELFGSECVPVNLPVGAGGGFSGVVSVLSPPDAPPDGVIGDVEEARGNLMETIVESDEELMERYLEDEAISPEEITKALRAAIAAGSVVPIFHCSGRSGAGVEELIEGLAAFAPSPAELSLPEATTPDGEAVELRADPDAPLAAQVFKSVTDPFVGKLSFFRVFSGTLKSDSSVHNSETGKNERVGHVLRPFGKETENVDACVAGDIGALSKVEALQIGDTLCAPERPVVLARPTYPTPMVSLAIMPRSRGDEQKIGQSVAKLCSEDPTFTCSRDEQTHEMVVTGMSQLHVDVMIARLKDRFEVEVDTKEPKIPYKETITAASDSRYRHKKQTGGRGQFAEVWIKMEPLDRGEGFEFVDEIVGGAIPSQYIPAVEKGVREQMAKGILAGCEVQDVRVRCHFGKFHAVDSSEQAFKTAAAMAFTEGFMAARPVLLEPVVEIHVMVPAQFMGDITGDLSSRRGRILGMESEGDLQTISAEVALAEVVRYATELSSMTGGVGSYTMEFKKYDIVPSNVAQTVIAAAQKARREG